MNKIYVLKNGECVFHDPGPEMIPVFLSIDPDYKVISTGPGEGFVPKYQQLRDRYVFLEDSPFDYSCEFLLDVLDGKINTTRGDRYAAIDILQAVAYKSLESCSFCGWNCSVNRFLNEKGTCGLGVKVYSRHPFLHIAEEPVINPSIVTNLGGCSLRCKYCIDYDLWDSTNLFPLNPDEYWSYVDKMMVNNAHITSIQFTNPTESLHGIINLLSMAPKNIRLPLVMNAHLYGSNIFYKISSYITDVYLLDMRYGNDICAEILSGVPSYMAHAAAGLNEVCYNNTCRVIIRILVLPSHTDCCHVPALHFLSNYLNRIYLSILDQYVPEHEAFQDFKLSTRPKQIEIDTVKSLSGKYMFRDVFSLESSFW